MQISRMILLCCRLVFVWIAGAFLAAGAPQQKQVSTSAQRALLNQYCVGCHNDRLNTGGLSLSSVSVENVDQNREVWEKVLRKVRARYMPPSGLPRPDEGTYEAFANYLETSLDRVATTKPDPGRSAALRRLTRTEYQNAIRDLLGLQVDEIQES